MTAGREHNLLDAFDGHWDDYRKQLKAGRREISEESIHDLRVSARRMQALLGMLRTLDGKARIKKMQRVLNRQLNQLDKLRDTQVMIHELDDRIGSLPQLVPFRDYLQDCLADLGRTGHKQLRKLKPSDLRPGIKTMRKTVKHQSDDPQLEEHLLQAVDGAYAKALARFGRLDAGNPNTIHQVRIAFKKLRYMIETVEPFLPKHPAKYLDHMHEYQDAMGNVHDTTVFLDTLKEYELDLKQLNQGEEPGVDLKPVEQFYRTRLADLILAYFQRKDEFYGFWRPAPDQPFPWEKSHDSVHRSTRNRRRPAAGQQRGEGQRAASHRRRSKEVQADRQGAGQSGNSDRPDTDQSVPTGS